MNVIPNINELNSSQAVREAEVAPEAPRFRIMRKHIWFFVFVVVPALAAILYYGLLASDVYVSEARFVIKSPGAKSQSVTTLASLIQTTGLAAGQAEADEVIGYLRSRSALKDLQKRVDVRAAYSSDAADTLARYPFPGTSDKVDNLFKYYRGMMDVERDSETNLIALRTKAFSADEAWRINRSLLDLSEALVNTLNQRAQDQAIKESQRRIEIAEARLGKVQLALAQYRNSQNLMDPEKQATGIIDIVSKLTIQRAELQSQLNVMASSAPRHPALPSLRAKLAAIDGAIAAQSGKVVGGNGAIASKVGGYEDLVIEQQFATQALTAANVAMEQARTEAAKQQFYLERIDSSNVPDIAEYPKRIKSILTISGAAVCLFFIAWMLIVGILEHSPED